MANVPLVEPEVVEEPLEGMAYPPVAEDACCSVLVTVSCESDKGRDAEADTTECTAEDTAEDTADVA